jgi:ribosomal protein S18 acetylase RimI-like enzyme
LCFGVYENATGAQVGFTRVVTDHATFAYLCDVYVLEAHRGHGIAKRMMREVMAHPALTSARRIMLATRDAHGLYHQSGFVEAGREGNLMEVVRAGMYRA